MVGIDASGVVWVYSGAIYNSSSASTAFQYDHGVLKFWPKKGIPFSFCIRFLIIFLYLLVVPAQYAGCMFPEACSEFNLMQIDTGHVLLGLFLSVCAGLGTTAGGLITFLPGAGEG